MALFHKAKGKQKKAKGKTIWGKTIQKEKQGN